MHTKMCETVDRKRFRKMLRNSNMCSSGLGIRLCFTFHPQFLYMSKNQKQRVAKRKKKDCNGLISICLVHQEVNSSWSGVGRPEKIHIQIQGHITPHRIIIHSHATKISDKDAR